MKTSSVLILGIGIAGPALAHWLLRYGFTPTLVERSERLRADGYLIDFWGVGCDIVEKMGLLPEVMDAGYTVREVRMVDGQGQRVGGFDAQVIRKAVQGHYTSLLRGDLAKILYRSIEHRAETIFGDSITSLDEDSHGVFVRFERSAPRRFDLVVGADGLHSTVRRLAFGPESEYERFLGYTVAAFAAADYRPRDEDVYVGYGVPSRQVARFAMRDGRTMFLLVSADHAAGVTAMSARSAQKAHLRERFSTIGWECSTIADLLDAAEDLYFDRVSQIRMQRWCTKRVALVGDAASCPSLLAGEGSALAILGAYVLAGELAKSRTPESAFALYEQSLSRFLREKQDAAEKFAGTFAPKTRMGLFLRNKISSAMALPFVAQLTLGRSLRDDITLPDFSAVQTSS
jgi:2-polyprenyl-6-methoxyphenol hydroxylase-like FAD-dependent oxidoreductase